MPEHVVIIGSGPAGWAAAIYAARANLKPLLFEGAMLQEHFDNGRPPLGQLSLTTEVENYPGFPAGDLKPYLSSALDASRQSMLMMEEKRHAVTGPELMFLMRQQAENFGTRIVAEDITSVDFGGKPFKLTTSTQTVEAHTVIIATGASANYLGLPSEAAFKNRGVSACAVCDAALPRFANHPVAVIGGGDSAVEEATYLTKFASKVYLVHRRDELRASKIMAQRAEDNEKIEILWNSVVDEVLGDDQNGMTGLRLKSTVDDTTHDVEANGMFVAIGHTPNTAFLNGQIETNKKGYVKLTTPFRTYTSVEGVYAAGDVADEYYRQAITSAGTGCMAALDAERHLAELGM
ncbi:MAG: FAD-dependent oxidoreductase [Planctomycetales bacterium]|nr:FAD-dependent oxidoreductase [Planctomycetales bacterium]